jgi:Ni/Co efflux regulator RcnB
MSRALLTALLIAASAASADEVVNAGPSAAELGRYSVVRTADTTARFDSATGGTWYLCANKKNKQAWCKGKEIPSLPPGPVGRYKLIEGTPLILIDSVTGRSWSRCELPTPEKGLAWCALEE